METATMSEPRIIGYAVFTKRIEQAALYNLDQAGEAFDAVNRWPGASIIGLVAHPSAPELPDSANENTPDR